MAMHSVTPFCQWKWRMSRSLLTDCHQGKSSKWLHRSVLLALLRRVRAGLTQDFKFPSAGKRLFISHFGCYLWTEKCVYKACCARRNAHKSQSGSTNQIFLQQKLPHVSQRINTQSHWLKLQNKSCISLFVCFSFPFMIHDTFPFMNIWSIKFQLLFKQLFPW